MRTGSENELGSMDYYSPANDEGTDVGLRRRIDEEVGSAAAAPPPCS
jgi:hypothetical protein